MTRFLPIPPLAAPLASLAVLFATANPAEAQTTNASAAQPAELSSNVNSGPMQKAEPMPFFFPPVPPPLEALAAAGTQKKEPITSAKAIAPAELAGYVGEIFYPALGGRLARHMLSPKLRQQVEQYRTIADALRQELRAQLDHLRGAAPAVRLRGLEDLARQQAPRLAELEKDAEQLRQSLTQVDHGWDDLREWRLRGSESVYTPPAQGAEPRPVKLAFSPGEIAGVMRAAAFYYPHLLPAQRGLLREIALELTLAATDATAASLAQPHVFFSPELARIARPEDLPANVAEKFARHQIQKSQIKKELYDAIYDLDRPGLNLGRNGRLKALAEQQATVLASLETLAEELRRELRLLPARAPAPSPLSPTLVSRIAAAAETQAATRRGAMENIQRIAARAVEFEIPYRFAPAGLEFQVLPILRPEDRFARPPSVEQTATIEAAMKEVALAYGRQHADQREEDAAIHEAVAQAIGTSMPAAVDAARTAALRHNLAQGAAGFEYRAAVFEPGLSVEQRRLLFAGAVERLWLPLPAREMQPTTRDAIQ